LGARTAVAGEWLQAKVMSYRQSNVIPVDMFAVASVAFAWKKGAKGLGDEDYARHGYTTVAGVLIKLRARLPCGGRKGSNSGWKFENRFRGHRLSACHDRSKTQQVMIHVGVFF